MLCSGLASFSTFHLDRMGHTTVLLRVHAFPKWSKSRQTQGPCLVVLVRKMLGDHFGRHDSRRRSCYGWLHRYRGYACQGRLTYEKGALLPRGVGPRQRVVGTGGAHSSAG